MCTCACACECVCERERERKRERDQHLRSYFILIRDDAWSLNLTTKMKKNILHCSVTAKIHAQQKKEDTIHFREHIFQPFLLLGNVQIIRSTFGTFLIPSFPSA
jgi:hypothetical protein